MQQQWIVGLLCLLHEAIADGRAVLPVVYCGVQRVKRTYIHTVVVFDPSVLSYIHKNYWFSRMTRQWSLRIGHNKSVEQGVSSCCFSFGTPCHVRRGPGCYGGTDTLKNRSSPTPRRSSRVIAPLGHPIQSTEIQTVLVLGLRAERARIAET